MAVFVVAVVVAVILVVVVVVVVAIVVVAGRFSRDSRIVVAVFVVVVVVVVLFVVGTNKLVQHSTRHFSPAPGTWQLHCALAPCTHIALGSLHLTLALELALTHTGTRHLPTRGGGVVSLNSKTNEIPHFLSIPLGELCVGRLFGSVSSTSAEIEAKNERDYHRR